MIEINNKIFKTKKDATQFIQNILYGYQLNESLEGDDLMFMLDVLKCHPDVNKKVGVGIKSIIVEKELTFNKTTHFSIIRTDGTKVDFSFVKCLTPSSNKLIKLFYSSARRAVSDQIIAFRDKFFTENKDSNGDISCALTGVLIDKSSSHVDHVPPDTFHKIVSDFIDISNIDVDSTKFIETADGIGREFSEEEIRNSFSDYHRSNARLRIVSPSANLQQKKK
jgi:hypothetical protein